jgi:chaperonin GroES
MEVNQMAVKPLEDRILIKPIEKETKTASGIFLPESATEKPMQGKVIATGPGKLLDNGERAKMSVKEGDTVVFGKYSGTEIEIKGESHLIVRESELLGLIKN